MSVLTSVVAANVETILVWAVGIDDLGLEVVLFRWSDSVVSWNGVADSSGGDGEDERQHAKNRREVHLDVRANVTTDQEV